MANQTDAEDAIRRARWAVDDAVAALEELEDLNDPQITPADPVELRYLDCGPVKVEHISVSDPAETLEDATDLLIRFYRRARDLGWNTAEMADAREYLRRIAPLEVW